jgi:hypothetical protein
VPSYFGVTSLYFFPQLLSAVVFSLYIGVGNHLDLAAAYTVLSIFNIIKDPLRWFPNMVGQMIEFNVSMKRIQNFLMCDEID